MGSKAAQKRSESAKSKTCFIIGPIGPKGSDVRRNADWLLYWIRPVLEELGYTVIRADEIDEPGTITDQVINLTVGAELVVADLTGPNPNAFYELGIRHREGKPVIHMITEGQSIPFDVLDFRAIEYSFEHPDVVEQMKLELKRQVEATQRSGYEVSNPVTRALGKMELKHSVDSRDKLFSDMLETTQRIERRMDLIESQRKATEGYVPVANVRKIVPITSSLFRLGRPLQGANATLLSGVHSVANNFPQEDSEQASPTFVLVNSGPEDTDAADGRKSDKPPKGRTETGGGSATTDESATATDEHDRSSVSDKDRSEKD